MRLLANNEVNEESKSVFLQAESDSMCQFIKIAGPTRSGKSTFANTITNGNHFQTSDSAEPCTRGIDFCALLPYVPISIRFGVQESFKGLLSILDIEGGGDRSLQYDVQNYLPAFMLPGVVVWNVLGHPPRTTLLNQLAVVSRVGAILVPSKGGPTFPNDLVIVIRDYTLTSTAEQILDRLLENEPEEDPSGEALPESAERNATRRVLQSAFLSIRVTVLPPRNEPEYREAEWTLIQDILGLMGRNRTLMTPPMCLDYLCDLTRQIEHSPQSVNVGSTLAYINLCEYNRRLHQAEEELGSMFQEWYADSRYITSVAEAEQKFEWLAQQAWAKHMPEHMPVTVGEGVGDTLEERRQRFTTQQRKAVLHPCIAQLKLLEAERTITQMELTVCGVRSHMDKVRHSERSVRDKATAIRTELLANGVQPDTFLPALGSPTSFEDYYNEHGLDALINSYTREVRYVETEGTSIADVLEVDMVMNALMAQRLGQVITVDDVVMHIM